MACINCDNQRKMALNGYETSGRNVKMTGNYKGFSRRDYKQDPKRTQEAIDRNRRIYYQNKINEEKRLANLPKEPQQVEKVTQPEPFYYSLTVNTTINPLLDLHNLLTPGIDRFYHWAQHPYDESGNFIGWKQAALKNGVSQEEINELQQYANRWAGSTSSYKPQFDKSQYTPITNTVTNYWDQYNNPVTSVPEGAKIIEKPTLNYTLDSEKATTKVYKQGGALNYFDYLK